MAAVDRRTFLREISLAVGAAAAGLAAARTLVANGFAVTILEARDRIVGRTVG